MTSVLTVHVQNVYSISSAVHSCSSRCRPHKADHLDCMSALLISGELAAETSHSSGGKFFRDDIIFYYLLFASNDFHVVIRNYKSTMFSPWLSCLCIFVSFLPILFNLWIAAIFFLRRVIVNPEHFFHRLAFHISWPTHPFIGLGVFPFSLSTLTIF